MTRRQLPRYSARAPVRGFTYVGVLIMVAVAGIAMAITGELWHTAAVRDKEAQLLSAGAEIQRALKQYRDSSPGAQRYPMKLEELLEDRRSLTVRRYLRRLYRDPMTGKADWGLVTQPDGSIVGVHSRSNARPMKTAGFSPEQEDFVDRAKYSEWVFRADTETTAAPVR